MREGGERKFFPRVCGLAAAVTVSCLGRVEYLQITRVYILECNGSFVHCDSVRCSALQCVAVLCSALQSVAVYCSVLQCVTVRCRSLQGAYLQMCFSALQCVSVFCSALQCVTVHCSALQCVAGCICAI